MRLSSQSRKGGTDKLTCRKGCTGDKVGNRAVLPVYELRTAGAVARAIRGRRRPDSDRWRTLFPAAASATR